MLDYQIIREILEYESQLTPYDNARTKPPKDKKELKAFNIKAHHYNMLSEIGATNTTPLEFTSLDGTSVVEIKHKGLTFNGHQLLDAMQQDTLWNQIKDSAKEMGVEGLKQIPALALTALIQG